MKEKEKTSGSEIWRGAWRLTAAALAAKVLGALYKIPLTRVLGSRGMGMYQSVFPMYALLVTLTGGGVTAAVSKSAAESDGRYDCVSAVACIIAVTLPLTATAALLSRTVARLSGAPEAAWAFAVLALSLPPSGVCAVLRGYFQGAGNVRYSAVGQLVEQSVKLISGLTLAYLLARISLTASVAGCAAGVTLAELATTAYYISRSRRGETRRDGSGAAAAAEGMREAFYGIEILSEISAELSPPPREAKAAGGLRTLTAAGMKKAFRSIFAVALPVTLGLIVLPLCQVADSFAVVNILSRSGVDKAVATSLYGLVTGPVNALVNIPAVFTVGMSGMILPKVSSLVKRRSDISRQVKQAMLFAVVTGVIFGAGLIATAGFAMRILGADGGEVNFSLAVKLLRISSATVPMVAVMQTASAVLQGCGKPYIPALGMAIAGVVKEGLNFILLPRIGILGFVIATVVFYAAALVADAVSLAVFMRKYASKKISAESAERYANT